MFFCGCNLGCVFCQNHVISAPDAESGAECDAHRLAEIYFSLMEQGAQNINLVTAAIHTPAVIRSIRLAKKQGLRLPFVWNTNAYERTETLRALDGLIDIYLPDIKYVSPRVSLAYSDAADYFEYAAPAVLEMQRQTGTLTLDENGAAKRGVLVRHLVLPCAVDQTRGVLDFVANNMPASTYVSLMRQYTPMYKALWHKTLGRRVTKREYESAIDYALTLGLENVYIQSAKTATDAYTPDFDGTGL